MFCTIGQGTPITAIWYNNLIYLIFTAMDGSIIATNDWWESPEPAPSPSPSPSPEKKAPFTLTAIHAGEIYEGIWTYSGTFPPPGFLGVTAIKGLSAYSTSPIADYAISFLKFGKKESEISDPAAVVSMKNTETLGPDKISLLTGGVASPKSINIIADSTLPISDKLYLVATFV